MAAQLSCSFASHSKSTCNCSARFPGKNEFFPLSSCTKDIKSHLRQLKVAQTSVISEKAHILARVGLFDLEGNYMTVCPKHRAALGTWWRPILKCYHPLHGNKRRKPERGESLQMCKEIMTKWNVLVPVGAGMFLFSIFGEAKIDTRGIPCLAKNDTGPKLANNSRSSDNCPVNLRFSTGKLDTLTGHVCETKNILT